MPDGKTVFGEGFNYLTGTTPEAVIYFKEVAAQLKNFLKLKKGDCVLDIGSNDGGFLAHMKSLGMEVIGVDPALRAALLAEKKGVSTIVKPFEDALPEVMQIVKGKLKLVTAFNVLAHTDRIHRFMDLIYAMCSNTGAHFVSQSHYLPDMVEKVEWDTVYHEHARYYSLTSLDELFFRHRMKIYHAEKVPYYGGSIVVYASSDWYSQTGYLRELAKRESRYRDSNILKTFAGRSVWNAKRLVEVLNEARASGKTIAGVGAPMKSATLLNFAGLDSRTITYLTELNPMKIGTYSPGAHIPVVEEGRVMEDKPDYLLILSWNVAPRIIANLRSKGFEGKFVLPGPEVQVLQ